VNLILSLTAPKNRKPALPRGLSTFILQRFVLIRSLFPPSFCPLPCLCCVRGSTISPWAVPLRTVMRLLPLLLPLHLPPSLLFMPEPRRRRQRTTALLQPADIPGLTHLQRAVVVAWMWWRCILPHSKSLHIMAEASWSYSSSADGRAQVALQAFVLWRTRHSPWRSKSRSTEGGKYCSLV
jgi:hypothetical protein